MRYVTKEITGYATSYKTAKQYSTTYPWSNVEKAFDWSPTVAPNSSGVDGSTDWWNTYASVKIYYSTSSTYRFKWYLDGIGTFKSCLDDNFNNSYNSSGTTYTNFSCIPDDSQLVQFRFTSRSSLAKYHEESIKYYKDSTEVTAVGSSSSMAAVYKTAGSSGLSVTETMNYDGLSLAGHIFTKNSSGVFVYSHMPEYNIGSWTLADFKNGKFLPRVLYNSKSSLASTTSYDYPRGFSLTLTVKIPAYTITTSVSDSNAGTVTGGGEYFSTKFATLTATANDGYEFSHWLIDGVDYGITTPTYVKVADKDTAITAVFKQNKINNVYGNTTKPSKVYVNKNIVKAIYVDNTKVYG